MYIPQDLVPQDLVPQDVVRIKRANVIRVHQHIVCCPAPESFRFLKQEIFSGQQYEDFFLYRKTGEALDGRQAARAPNTRKTENDSPYIHTGNGPSGGPVYGTGRLSLIVETLVSSPPPYCAAEQGTCA